MNAELRIISNEKLLEYCLWCSYQIEHYKEQFEEAKEELKRRKTNGTWSCI
jgi:hypothetical protein